MQTGALGARPNDTPRVAEERRLIMSTRSFRATLSAGLIVLALATSAAAVQIVSHCSDTCTTDCLLAANLQCCPLGANPNCDGTGPITLTNGADLDLNGFTIECQGDGVTPGSTCNYDAVTMTSSGSVVKSSATATEGKITGLFVGGVDCQLKTQSRVTGIHFEGLATKGNPNNYDVENCAQVDKNVFFGNHDGISTGGAAIYSYGVANNDQIYDNYVQNFFIGIETPTELGIKVDHNIVVTTGPNTAIGIDSSYGTSSTIDVNHNVIRGPFDSGVAILGSGFSTHFTQNHCEHANTTGCSFCITHGWCAPFKAPFAGLR
jgi:hypothetical protein